MRESAEKRSPHDSHVRGELMASKQGSRQPQGWLREAWAEARMRAAAVIMNSPGAHHPPQMLFAERNPAVQTLSTEAAEEALTRRIRPWGLEWGPEDPDTHLGDDGVQPRRKAPIPIVEDEPVAMRFRKDLAELLEGPGGGRVRRDVDVEQAAAAHLERDEDVEDPERGRHHDAEVAGHEGLGVIPHEHCPPLVGLAGWFSSIAILAAHIPADGSRRHAEPEFQEEFRGDPLLAPGRIVPGHGGDQALQLRREPRPAGPGAPEELKGLAVPTEERGRLDDGDRLPPGQAAREEDQREPERVRRAPGFHLPRAVEGQLFAKEEILGSQGSSGPEAGAQEPHEIDRECRHHPAHMDPWLYPSLTDPTDTMPRTPRTTRSYRITPTEPCA